MKKILTLIFTTILFIPLAHAKTINHSYAEVGSNIDFNENVNGASALAGDNISSNGYVNGINLIAGNDIELRGTSEYALTAGNVISINGNIKNDAFIAGNIVDIKEKTIIERDTIIAASDVQISGVIQRNVTIYAAKVDIKSANIKGNVRIVAEEIKIDDQTNIEGKLFYPKDAKTKISSKIKNITKTPAITKDKETILDIVLNKIWSALSLILIFALLTLFAPKIFEKIDDKYEKLGFNKVLELFSKGLVFTLIVPAISIFLLMFPFTISLSLIMTALYIIIIYLSKIFTAYLIGYKLWQKYIEKQYIPLISGLLGFTILFILDLIPIISPIITIISLMIGIGMITEMYKKQS